MVTVNRIKDFIIDLAKLASYEAEINTTVTATLNSIISAISDEASRDTEFIESIAEKEKWLKNAASSVDIFISKESIGATKNIVIQVDGTGYHN